MLLFIYVFVLFITCQVLAEVTVLKIPQYIYENSPTLRINGSGFDMDESDLTLELNVMGQPSLIPGRDYFLRKIEGEGLILKLLPNRQWADLSSRIPPLGLILSSVKFKGMKTNLLAEPIIVAQVLQTPTVHESTQTVFQTATNEIRINGTGFIGSKTVNIYFQPPLVKDYDYDDVTRYPVQKDQVVFRLRHNSVWRWLEGPLNVSAVDTGGGPVKLLGKEGVVIAIVVKDPVDYHKITVDSTIDQQLIYADEPNLIIKGSGFDPLGNKLSFENGLFGSGIHYKTISSSQTTISLSLVPGRLWRRDFENLPGPLTVMVMNPRRGFIIPANSEKKDIAMIFERPNVLPDHKFIHRTQSHELHIKGTGFPEKTSSYKPMLKFDPPLTEGVDYSLRVVNRTDLKVTLLEGKAWVPPLKECIISLFVTAINTRGDDTGWVKFDNEGVHVALVVRDVGIEESSISEVVKEPVESTGISSEVFSMAVKVYRSESQRKIEFIGKGFSKGVSFSFDSSLKDGIDYEVGTMSDTKVTLLLK